MQMVEMLPKVNSRAQSLIGRKINNYNVVSLLGMGGMGAVYVAEHPFIDRKVAIKVLKREFTEDDSLIRRFFNEAKAASAIRHPNIVEIFDMGELDDGIPYIVMELLAGENLGSLIQREKQLELGAAIRIAEQTAAALTAAHAKGIVHRDLKPDNLHMVTVERGMETHVKVLDFGIAKLRPEMAGSNGSTNTGAVMGTPPYMSPEQCLGINGDIDTRTDIYALGVILFEMLCGRPPFVGSGMGEVMVAHVTLPPPLPSSFNPKVPPHVEGIILKALAKKREDRYATMAEFQAALLAPAAQVVAPPPTRLLAEAPASVAAASSFAKAASRLVRTTTPLPAVTTQAAYDLRAELQIPSPNAPAAPSMRKKLAIILGAVAAVGLLASVMVMRGKETPAPVALPSSTPEPAQAAQPRSAPVPPAPSPEPVLAPEPLPTRAAVADDTAVQPASSQRPTKVKPRERSKPSTKGLSPVTAKSAAVPAPVDSDPTSARPKVKNKIIPSIEF